ncbi:MAG: DUF72 domain-containing protein [Candidatus Geothermincolia bacterium]
MTVFVGTAGFSYTDWKGTFYLPEVRPAQMLERYAEHFPVVEINSTYYAIPEPGRLNAMALRTPPWFLFNVKANREMTHEIGNGVKVFEDFRRAIRPLQDHGKLGCVLAQFPWGFKRTAANESYIEKLARRLEGMDTVVEFRNSRWEDDETLDMLSALGLGYVCVDEPRLQGLLSPRVAITARTAYLRMHGRNAETWWAKGRESWERYDYLYSEEELAEWLPGIEKMDEQADRVYVIFNNHYKGQAPANARTFEQMLRAIIGSDIYIVDEAGKEPPETLFD